MPNLFMTRIIGAGRIRGNFESLDERFHARILQGADNGRKLLESQVRANIARQFNNPGKMLSTVASEVVDQWPKVTATVDVSGRLSGVTLPYMNIHEYGGQTAPHVIFPSQAMALRFIPGGGFAGTPSGGAVFARRVNHPGSRIPERSYLRTALRQRRSEVIEAFESAITGALRSQ